MTSKHGLTTASQNPDLMSSFSVNPYRTQIVWPMPESFSTIAFISSISVYDSLTTHSF
jgi:hypothetical protein